MKNTKNTKNKTSKQTTHGNSFIDAIVKYWRGYVDFKGATSRKDFWFAVLFVILLDILFEIINVKILSTLLTAVLFLPSRAIAFRRYHDAGFSGLLNLIPYSVFFVWAGIQSERWLFFLNLETIPTDLKLFMMLGFVWVIFNLVVLLKPSKTKNNSYSK